MKIKGKKVFVGLSGGVDSSVSTALLKKAGYDVTAVFMKTWHPDFLPCTWKEDRLDAMRVAAYLDIPFLTFDFEEEYKKDVADYMISEYAKGRTPNPDVMCNKYVKFGAFFEKAREMGADFIATGHYGRNVTNQDGLYELQKGVDTGKDQTYFLWTLTQEKLANCIFPIGTYEKKEVRKLAREFGLPTAERKESQGVCFLGELNMKEFLKSYIEEKKGDVLNKSGEVIGHHEGAVFSTLGQRHGFTITKKDRNDPPYYIVRKNISDNTLTVAHEKIREEYSQKVILLQEVNWIDPKGPRENQSYQARFRYRQPLEECTLEKNETGWCVHFSNLQEPFAPGQSLVIYDKEKCVGGGIMA